MEGCGGGRGAGERVNVLHKLSLGGQVQFQEVDQ